MGLAPLERKTGCGGGRSARLRCVAAAPPPRQSTKHAARGATARTLYPGFCNVRNRILRNPLLLAVLLAGCVPARYGHAPPGTDFISRSAWGAAPPVLAMQPHTLHSITIHHTATPQRAERPLAEKLRALQRFSQTESPLASGRTKPPWPDIPYHYYIDPAGRIAEARSLRYAGDSNTAYDPAGHLLIVLEGNFEEEMPTPAQLDALARLTRWHVRRWRIPAERIGVHKDYADTLCPGRNLEYYIPWLRAYAGGQPPA